MLRRLRLLLAVMVLARCSLDNRARGRGVPRPDPHHREVRRPERGRDAERAGDGDDRPAGPAGALGPGRGLAMDQSGARPAAALGDRRRRRVGGRPGEDRRPVGALLRGPGRRSRQGRTLHRDGDRADGVRRLPAGRCPSTGLLPAGPHAARLRHGAGLAGPAASRRDRPVVLHSTTTARRTSSTRPTGCRRRSACCRSDPAGSRPRRTRRAASWCGPSWVMENPVVLQARRLLPPVHLGGHLVEVQLSHGLAAVDRPRDLAGPAAPGAVVPRHDRRSVRAGRRRRAGGGRSAAAVLPRLGARRLRGPRRPRRSSPAAGGRRAHRVLYGAGCASPPTSRPSPAT